MAHALGTFAGAVLAALMAANHKLKFAMAIGIFFLLGGFANTLMLPAPMWFNVTDVVLAYIPVIYLAGKLVVSGNK